MKLRSLYFLTLLGWANSIPFELNRFIQISSITNEDLSEYDPDQQNAIELKDYLIDNGYWFEICMNIQ
jgi:hypothetical protein